MPLCVRELVWNGQADVGVWHLAGGAEGENPMPIRCGSGAYFTIIDPKPLENREPTCLRCRNI